MSKRTATFPEHSPFINGPLMMSNREYAMPTMSSGRTPSTVSSQTGRIQDLRKSLLASNTFIIMNRICRRRQRRRDELRFVCSIRPSNRTGSHYNFFFSWTHSTYSSNRIRIILIGNGRVCLKLKPLFQKRARRITPQAFSSIIRIQQLRFIRYNRIKLE